MLCLIPNDLQNFKSAKAANTKYPWSACIYQPLCIDLDLILLENIWLFEMMFSEYPRYTTAGESNYSFTWVKYLTVHKKATRLKKNMNV